MDKRRIVLFISLMLVSILGFAAGTKRVSATKNRNCSKVVIVNNSSETVRIAEADGSSVTGWIRTGQQSSLNVNSIVLEIGSNCNATSSVSGSNFVITVTGSSSSSGYSSNSSSSSNNNRCSTCYGSGKCHRCNGKGSYYSDGHYGPNASNLNRYVKCDRCNGTGKCSYCHGSGNR